MMFNNHGRRAGVLALAVTGVLVLGVVTAFGSTAGAAARAHASSGARIAMELLFTGVPFAVETQAGAEAGAAAAGVSITVSGPPTLDPPTAIAQINSFLAAGVKGLAVGDEPAPLWTRALSTAYSKTNGDTLAYEAVPVSGTVKTFVGVGAGMIGRQIAADTIAAAKLGPSTTGQVIVGQCVPDSTPLLQTANAMVAEAKKLLPKATVLPQFDSQVVPSANFTAWQQEMRAHPAAVLALGSCDQDGDSMIKAKQVVHGHFAIGGTDVDPTVLAGLADGQMAADVAQNWFTEGYVSARLVGQAALGAKLPQGWINPGTTLITKANVAKFKKVYASNASLAAYSKPLAIKFWSNLKSETKPLSEAASA